MTSASELREAIALGSLVAAGAAVALAMAMPETKGRELADAAGLWQRR